MSPEESKVIAKNALLRVGNFRRGWLRESLDEKIEHVSEAILTTCNSEVAVAKEKVRQVCIERVVSECQSGLPTTSLACADLLKKSLQSLDLDYGIKTFEADREAELAEMKVLQEIARLAGELVYPEHMTGPWKKMSEAIAHYQSLS